ncbi:MAG: exosortase/archaeosortase family protein [Candidatus Bathyarchaeota archaeon]
MQFVVPLVVLYNLNPGSFDSTWKGRAYYIIFVWLTVMEVILNWKRANKIGKLMSIRSLALLAVLLLPTIYVFYSNYLNLNNLIIDIAAKSNVSISGQMPLSIEYIIFAAFFGLIITILYGTNGLTNFSVPLLLLVIMGTLYTIDNFYPYGRFTPLQILVPATATLSASFLSLLGYQTRFIGYVESTPVLQAWNSSGGATFGIAWPCAGVEGLIVYTVTILLFLKQTEIPLKQKALYFTIGAVVTYFINILRIVTIFTIASNQGDYLRFHNYYGQMYSIIWITAYMLIIFAIQTTWKNKKNN